MNYVNGLKLSGYILGIRGLWDRNRKKNYRQYSIKEESIKDRG